MKTFLFGFAALFAFSAAAQSSAFQLIYGNEASQEVGVGCLQLADGAIYLLGNILSDTTNGQDVFLVKVGLTGEVVWEKSYDLGGVDFANAFVYQPGRFLIVGETNETNGFAKKSFVMEVNEAGELLAANLYGTANLNRQFQGISNTATGYLACGYVNATTGAGNDVLVRHFGNGLSDSWEKTLGAAVNDIGMSVGQLPNGNYVLCGDRQVDTGQYNAFVMILDNRGEILHETLLSSEFNGGSKQLEILPSGKVLVVGEMATPTSLAFDIFLAQLDSEGNLEWMKYVPGTNASDAGFALKSFNGATTVITGYSYNEAAGNSDIMAISVDATGTEIDRKYFGGSSLDIGYDIRPSLSGGLLVAGKTLQGTQQDAILIHDFLEVASPVEEKAGPESLRFSPNPVVAGGVVSVPAAWSGSEWRLFDAAGKEVAGGSCEGSGIRLDAASGIYWLQLKLGEKLAGGKLRVD